MKAYLFETLADDQTRCNLCRHRCKIKAGKSGICGVRQNRSGELVSLVFGRVVARNVDPVEKKPLFHFYPGSMSYSIATVGCNFKCNFCQNADIAQMPKDHGGRIMGRAVTPAEIVAAAKQSRCQSIAYTYTEPTVYFEFAYEVAKLAHQQGISNLFVTNGYMTTEALDMIDPYLDAANVDLKAFDDEFYRSYCGARLAGVKESLVSMKKRGIFIEVTTLLIPGLNDDPEEIMQLAHFIATDLGIDTPWHISRFHPTYKLTDRPPTPVETLIQAHQIGKDAGLRYVYTGNVPGEASEKTFCYACGKVLIDRWGFNVSNYAIIQGKCKYCEAEIDGVGL